ncbi:MAG: ABC transporter ATP-binding protein [Lachnospiraceae bacterium]|nr:ABC transporter ATP-binding protein [Lachnospiraceae bacterium]
MLRMRDVRKNYKGFSLNCSLEVPKDRITGIIGPNGAGKSTAFKAVLGLIGIDGGEIELLGKPISDFTVRDKERLGVTLADSGFSGYLTAADIIRIQKQFYPAFNEAEFRGRLEEARLPLNKQIREFSTGMKAKLRLFCALSHEAELLILDEPTAGLDVVARDELLTLLREYMERGERSIVISSHISSDLEGLCDDLYMISDGEIVWHEDTDRLLSDYALLKVFEADYSGLAKDYLLRVKRESYGCLCLTDKKQFYRENYPGIVIENSSIDDFMLLMMKGERV